MPDDENTHELLQIDGSLPHSLSGRFLWIEHHPTGTPSLHSIALHSGTAGSYRRRLITTRAANGAPTSNLIAFAGRIMALADGAIAHELGPNLDSNPVDAAGHHLGIGAYPKIDPINGNLHLISSPGEMTALHHVISAGGMTRQTYPIADPPAPIVDLAITADHVVFFADGFTGRTDRTRNEPVAWLRSYPTRPGTVIRAHDEHGDTVVHVVGEGLDEWTITSSAAIVDRRVLDATMQHPSRRNEGLAGSAHRYLYAVGGTTLFKHDLVDGTREDRVLGAGRQVCEFLFAADPERHAHEDGGWLLGVIHDRPVARFSLVVLDAASINGQEVACIRLPPGKAPSLRGLWMPTAE